MHRRSPSEDDLLKAFAGAYREVTRSDRQPGINDRLTDLGVDSLDAIDILVLVEDTVGVVPVDLANADLGQLATVGDLLDYVSRRLTAA